MTVLDLGGIVQQISVPDKNGDLTDVILGYNSVEGYENNGGYLGALIGRFGNRIGGGRLVIRRQRIRSLPERQGKSPARRKRRLR